jgi:hypothetical protein
MSAKKLHPATSQDAPAALLLPASRLAPYDACLRVGWAGVLGAA